MKNRALAILILIATIIPWGYMVYFMSSFGDASLTTEEFDARFKLHTYAIFYIWALMAIYIVSVFKSKTLPNEKRTLWAVVLFMGNLMAMPVYWYLYIWQQPKNS